MTEHDSVPVARRVGAIQPEDERLETRRRQELERAGVEDDVGDPEPAGGLVHREEPRAEPLLEVRVASPAQAQDQAPGDGGQ